MEFTPEQEQLLVEKNMPKIYRAVDNYTARHSAKIARVPYDDFVQEVSIAYIKYIRGCKTMEETNKFPWYSAMGAMRDLVLQFQPMSCEKSQHRFSEIIHSMPTTMSMDAIQASTGLEIDGMSKHWVEDKEMQIDFDAFMSEQPENTRRVACMRVYGMTLKEVSEQCGIPKSTIVHRLDRLNKSFKKYMDGDCHE